MFIEEEEAKRLAKHEILTTLNQRDRLFAPLSNASLGKPVLVRNVFGEPSYWLVPLLSEDKLVGFVRVLGDGRIAHIGTFFRDAGGRLEAPPTITGIDASEARIRAAERINRDIGEAAADPVFIHDGPVGKEAWLIEVMRDRVPIRWIFVTPAFIYERPAGTSFCESLE